MKNGKKKKLFMEHLEKRHSTSPLLVQVRSTEELAMIEKFKKIMQVKPDGLDKEMIQKTNVHRHNGMKKLSDDKFLKRIESKHEALNKAAADRGELMGKIAARTKSQSDNKFAARIEAKQEALKNLAIRKEELMGSLHKVNKRWGIVERIKRLLRRHSDVYNPYTQEN